MQSFLVPLHACYVPHSRESLWSWVYEAGWQGKGAREEGRTSDISERMAFILAACPTEKLRVRAL